MMKNCPKNDEKLLNMRKSAEEYTEHAARFAYIGTETPIAVTRVSISYQVTNNATFKGVERATL